MIRDFFLETTIYLVLINDWLVRVRHAVPLRSWYSYIRYVFFTERREFIIPGRVDYSTAVAQRAS